MFEEGNDPLLLVEDTCMAHRGCQIIGPGKQSLHPFEVTEAQTVYIGCQMRELAESIVGVTVERAD